MARVLVRLPQVLVIRLNRALPNERRVDCSIEFDEELDVSDRLLQPESRSGHNAIDYSGGNCESMYRLYGVVFHEGRSVRSGHYIAYVRRSAYRGADKGGRRDDDWVCCDDHDIVTRAGNGRALSPSEEERDRRGGRATLLFYERCD